MSCIEPLDSCHLTEVEDDSDFRAFAANRPSGIEMRAEEYGEPKNVVLKSDAGVFAKWLRTQEPELNVVMDEKLPRLVLRSSDIWLPLAFLASDVALPIYLNLVSNYLYEKMKGALRGEIARVHLCAEFEDKANGKVKRFSFDGDVDALQKAIKRFDLNRFLDE
ncbi:MAG: hypothetical protein HZA63_10410 [Rhodocyclales bacterium]|nr:hypothetical protein [Rhodocyclales bacterium]